MPDLLEVAPNNQEIIQMSTETPMSHSPNCLSKADIGNAYRLMLIGEQARPQSNGYQYWFWKDDHWVLGHPVGPISRRHCSWRTNAPI
jgi:hypothetical protein